MTLNTLPPGESANPSPRPPEQRRDARCERTKDARRWLASAFSHPTVLLYGFGALFQITVIAQAFTRFDTVVARTVPDDAFYYFKIAQNISAGQGSVFSPGEPTNGYHPLWMVVLVVVHFVTRPSPETFVLESLLVAAALNLLAATLLCRLLATFGFSEAQSGFGALLYLTLPWTVNLTLSGLETPLYFVCLFGFLLAAQRCFDAHAPLRERHGVVLGLAAGLLMLARTDGLLFTARCFWRSSTGGSRCRSSFWRD